MAVRGETLVGQAGVRVGRVQGQGRDFRVSGLVGACMLGIWWCVGRRQGRHFGRLRVLGEQLTGSVSA